MNHDLKKCGPEQTAIFRQYSVDPFSAPIMRYGELEYAVVIARGSGEVLYWEDAEEGFNLSSVGLDGRILEHWCSQDD